MHLALRERARQFSAPPPAPRCSQRTLFFWAAGLLLAGDALFWTLYAQVQTTSGIVLLDGPFHNALVAIRGPVLTLLLGAVTTATAPLWMSVIGVAFSGTWWLRSREAWRPALLLLAMGFTVALSSVVKEWVGRPRPSSRDFLMGPDDALSFPSGHTLGTAVFLFILAYFLVSRSSQRSTAVLAPAAALAVTLLVAFSRVYLGYHWMSDVLASIGLGLAVTAVVVFVDAVRLGPNRPVPEASISDAARRSA